MLSRYIKQVPRRGEMGHGFGEGGRAKGRGIMGLLLKAWMGSSRMYYSSPNEQPCLKDNSLFSPFCWKRLVDQIKPFL